MRRVEREPIIKDVYIILAVVEYAYSMHRTGTSLQVRLVRGVFSNANEINLFIMVFPRLHC